jgi:hypothetical protein
MGKENVVKMHNGILLSLKRRNPVIYDMDETGEHNIR